MKKHFKSFMPLLLLVVIAASCKKGGSPYQPPVVVVPKDTTFYNPLLPSGPDPFVTKKDSFYYYSHTMGDQIKLWRTKAMSQLNNAYTQTIWSKPATGPNSQKRLGAGVILF